MNTPSTDIQIKDLMTQNVITVTQDTPVIEVARLLVTHRISSIPVLDSNQHLVGMISISDVYMKEDSIHPTQRTLLSLFNAPVIPSLLLEVYARRGSKILAEDIMQPTVIWISESDSLVDAIQRMRKHKVNSLPVLRAPADGASRLAGIVTRSDIIGHLIGKPEVLSRMDINISRLSNV